MSSSANAWNRFPLNRRKLDTKIVEAARNYLLAAMGVAAKVFERANSGFNVRIDGARIHEVWLGSRSNQVIAIFSL